jgi:ABC-type glycerol-3-phosphate transport system substrate-binding protein
VHKKYLANLLSRRDFLRSSAGLLATGALLNGCVAPAPGATPGGAAPAEGSQSIEEIYVMTVAAFADMGMRDATQMINDALDDENYRYVLEESPDGWETKVLAMIRENDVRWSANGIADSGKQWSYIQMGLVQPLDDMLAASSVPWAQSLAEQYVDPKIDEYTKFEGKTYYVPMKLNIHLMGYREDYLKAAGYEEIPETWDEFDVMLGKLKETHADENVVPFACRKEVFRTLGTAFTTFVENPYNSDNMLRIDSEEWLDCIAMFKSWFDRDYTNLAVLQDPMPDWQSGKVAIGIDSHSWIRIGRSIWTAENVKGTVPPKTDRNNPLRTWIHLDSGFVPVNAPNPQEGLDWLLTMLGPEGAPADRHWSGTLTFSGMPVHQNQYEKLIANTDQFPEIKQGYDALATSTMVPLAAGRYYPIIQSKIWPWLERYWGNEIDGRTAMQNVMDEVEQELEKQIAGS